ncbi:phage head closure protein [Virgibacillus salexigens]|uniref:phage head closure protein n=1 Tax=Virgibacillus salexigens TaxID=61016 RepID=UPI00190A82D8|nr:phage head closure protein [Virgibacillus salexigens]
MVDVIVQRYTSASDGQGGETNEWTTHLEISGTLDKLNGDEVLANEKLGIVSSHIFIVFDVLDITELDRFIIDNKIYRVKDVDNPMNMDRQLEITLEYTGDKYEI